MISIGVSTTLKDFLQLKFYYKILLAGFVISWAFWIPAIYFCIPSFQTTHSVYILILVSFMFAFMFGILGALLASFFWTTAIAVIIAMSNKTPKNRINLRKKVRILFLNFWAVIVFVFITFRPALMFYGYYSGHFHPIKHSDKNLSDSLLNIMDIFINNTHSHFLDYIIKFHSTGIIYIFFISIIVWIICSLIFNSKIKKHLKKLNIPAGIHTHMIEKINKNLISTKKSNIWLLVLTIASLLIYAMIYILANIKK